MNPSLLQTLASPMASPQKTSISTPSLPSPSKSSSQDHSSVPQYRPEIKVTDRNPTSSSPEPDQNRRNSYYSGEIHNSSYRGYSPALDSHRMVSRKLPVILQFHGGGFVSGSNDSTANDFFCPRMAKILDVIVIAVGYRLAPDKWYPAAFDDGLKVLNWLGKQVNLAECSKSMWSVRSSGGADLRRSGVHWHIADTFGASMVEPWLAAHGNPSRLATIALQAQAHC